MKSLYFLAIILVLNGCSVGVATYAVQKADHSEFVFHFQKGLWPNTYYLKIKNNSPNRIIAFGGNFEDYYILARNGIKIPLDVSSFYGIGMKGAYWVNPNNKGAIPYTIPKHIARNAEKAVFKGTVFIEKREEWFMQPTDQRTITVTYRFDTHTIGVEIGTEILPEPKYSPFLNYEEFWQDNDDYLEKGLDVDEFRLRGRKFNELGL